MAAILSRLDRHIRMLVRTETELETTSCSAVQDSWLRNARVQALPPTEWKTAENDTSTRIHQAHQPTQLGLQWGAVSLVRLK
jgi:hypothetical protein